MRLCHRCDTKLNGNKSGAAATTTTKEEKATKRFMCKNYAPFNKQCLSQYFIDIYRVCGILRCCLSFIFLDVSLAHIHAIISNVSFRIRFGWYEDRIVECLWVCVCVWALISKRKKKKKNETFTVCVGLSILHRYDQYALHCDTAMLYVLLLRFVGIIFRLSTIINFFFEEFFFIWWFFSNQIKVIKLSIKWKWNWFLALNWLTFNAIYFATQTFTCYSL